MTDAVITVILTQVVTILDEQIRQEIRLVTGVGKEVKKLKTEFESIKAVLVDAEKRRVEDETVKVWLDNIKDVSYDTEDVLSEWLTAIRKAQIHGLQNPSKIHSFLTLPCVGFNRVAHRRDIAIKIKKINERLASIATDRLRNKKTSLNIMSVIGLGGIGKTTLAQVAYNSSEVIREFDLRIWVCVLEHFDEVRIAKAILEDVEGSAPYLFELETAARRIRQCIRGKKFLLVLDDVWTEDFRKWEQLWNTLSTGSPGSAVLVTTRSERVAKAMGSSYDLRLEELSRNDSWTLFEKIAFHERSREECKRFEVVGRQISDKCKGRPLTVRTIASLMRSKTSLQDWSEVLASEIWALKEAKGLFPPLMLSYDDLHPSLKPCFLFCAVFPKDHVIKADDLIKLWMAQGYLESSDPSVAMEDLGHEYLQNLAMRSFFQDMKTEKDGNRIVSVKMHDMVHDFAHYLTKNECSILEVTSDLERKIELGHERARHMTLIRSEDGPFPKVPNVERLSTYWVQSFYDSPPIVSKDDRVEAEFFDRLPRLKALDLSRNRIGELAKEIGNLVLLKFLNLSHNPIHELPDSLCELYNLQTLKLSACSRLRKLPQGIGKLVNLRHVEIDRTDSLKTLPKGIGEMESLQTLSKFVVGCGKDTIGEATCKIADLNKLNDLRGCLKIEGLGCVTNVDEAKTAKLHEKSSLVDVEMNFSPANKIERQEEVIEALEPQKNLQCLQISSYKGLKLPKWIMTLTDLRKLCLKDCPSCADLPPLGRLPSLETLHIEGMSSVKVLGIEFLGVGAEKSTAFPMLKQLKMLRMESWEEWKISSDNESERFEMMPRLRCLKIVHCAKLKALPVDILRKRSIGKLRIEQCSRRLEEDYYRETGVELSKIPHIAKIRVCY
ncbi:putative disease resistance protein RGA3 isoform X2 [Andrographis paniculata]|uniref:putative disease resistance protein RGA3 isoform X2 n=1 Tax=Andrographis paniculata TaxID=175694 RepID=UPI0021E81E11|nr:putative disease resistance protein RGA3 isoform X2 [Andrographis paniculata]